MVTTRSQSLSTRLQTTTKTTRQLSDKTISPYATRSTRMNTRSNSKRFIELTERQESGRMTRSMTKFVDKYSDYTGVKTRSMARCM